MAKSWRERIVYEIPRRDDSGLALDLDDANSVQTSLQNGRIAHVWLAAIRKGGWRCSRRLPAIISDGPLLVRWNVGDQSLLVDCDLRFARGVTNID